MQFRTSTRSISVHWLPGNAKIQSWMRTRNAKPQNVAGAPQRSHDARGGRRALPLAAVHQKRQGHTGEKEEHRRRQATQEVGENKRARTAQILPQERMIGMALQHDDGSESADPVQELQP